MKQNATMFQLSKSTEAVVSRIGLMLVQGGRVFWLSGTEVRKLRATLDELEKGEE